MLQAVKAIAIARKNIEEEVQLIFSPTSISICLVFGCLMSFVNLFFFVSVISSANMTGNRYHLQA